MKLQAYLLLLIVALTGGCAHEPEAVLPTAEMRAEYRKKGITIKNAVLQARELELVALDPLPEDPRFPNRPQSLGLLNGFKIVGQSTTRDRKEIQDLADALERGITDGLMGAGCFLPRHAIRFVTHDGPAEIVVCFHCSNGEMHLDSQTIGFVINGKSEPIFDSIFSRHGLRKAEFPTK